MSGAVEAIFTAAAPAGPMRSIADAAVTHRAVLGRGDPRRNIVIRPGEAVAVAT
jgi:hypothetical protein